MSDTSDERSPRFTRAILGRILAVVAFGGLGTFAVIQSVVSNRNKTEVAQPDSTEVQSLQQTDPNSDKVALEKPFQPILKPTKTAQGSSNNPQSASKSFTPPKKPSTFGNNSFGTKPNTSVPSLNSSRPSLKPAVTPSPDKVAANRPPVVVATQAGVVSTPRASTTQLNSFSAKRLPNLAAVQQGDKKPAARSTTVPPVNPAAGTSNPSKSAANAFGGAASGVAQKPNKIASKSTNGALQTANGTQSGAGNEFKSSTGTVKSLSSVGERPLRPSFGERPTTAQPNSVSRQSPPSARRTTSGQPGASFDTSRDLKPFNQAQSLPSAAATRPSAQRTNPPLNGSSQRQPVRSFGASQISSSSPGGIGPDPRTLATPGDRQLEGLRAPALTVEKIAPREIQVNQPADFQIVVRNVGRVTATDVEVSDRIPAGTEFVSAVPQATRSNSSELRWNLGEMRPGQEKRIKFKLNPIRPGEIGSVAQVTFATQASMRTLVTKPELYIHHSAQAKVLIGENVILDITVENKGDGPANHVMIQEDVPRQLEFNNGFHELEYEIGTLRPGQSKNLRLALRAAEIGRLKNVLMVTASGGLKAQHAIDMEVIAPQLVASGQGPRRRFLKREATHQFSVENKGTAIASNVELISRLPSGLKFVAANNRGKYDPNSHSVYWSLAELTPGVVGSVELKTLPIEAGEQKINFEAVADLNQKAQASQSLVVEHLIDVFFEIDDAVDPIEIGATTSYNIHVVNQGTKTATNVVLQVDFPNGIQPVSVDGNLPNEIRGQQVLFAPITSMSPGDELKLVVHGKGISQGDHRVVVRMKTDGRETAVSKEETTRVYDDR